MSAATSIEWTQNEDGTPGKTWNPVRGCSRVSPGCDRCYAMHFAHRFSGEGGVYEGLTVLRPKNAKRPGVDWSGRARFVPEMLSDPLRWRKPQRVFVNSMSDLFHESLSNEQIAAVFGVMAACPQHTFQILTKRPERAAAWFKWVVAECSKHHGCERDTLHHALYPLLPDDTRGYKDPKWQAKFFDQYDVHAAAPGSQGARWPLPNVWLGASVENQKTVDDRVSILLELPAALRFISAEPLLEKVTIWAFLKGETRDKSLAILGGAPLPGLDWVIVGGESGNGARPFDLCWAEDIVRECRDADVACFVKQLGSHPCFRASEELQSFHHTHGELFCKDLRDRKGGDMSEWPESLRVREFPQVRS